MLTLLNQASCKMPVPLTWISWAGGLKGGSYGSLGSPSSSACVEAENGNVSEGIERLLAQQRDDIRRAIAA